MKTGYFIYYTEASIVCVILFGIMLGRDILSADRQEKQIRFDRALIAFMLYFISDALWAAIIAGIMPRNRFTVVATNFSNYVIMAAITYLSQILSSILMISMIFQSFNLLDQRTSLDNICFPLELAGVSKKEARKRAMELLEMVGLPDKKDAYPVQLSGGQKQRIAIARALASNPEVLLCDEATSALDPQTTRDVLRLIQDINKRLGITVIIITHDMSVIEEICGRVAILNHGKVAEIGTVESVFSSPKSEAGRKLVYPDGLPFEMLPKSKVVRVAFNGGTAYQPLIATLAMECGVVVNILGADTRNIDGKAFGSMLLGLPENDLEAAKALAYIASQKDITVEEVQNYHA